MRSGTALDTARTCPAFGHGLRLAPDLVLSPAAAQGRLALVGGTGTGKSTTARRFVEEAARHQVAVVVIDLMGTWRSIRHGREGGPGLGFLVAGDRPGDHLAIDDAESLATAVARGSSVVVDLSGRGAGASAVAVLLEELYAWAGSTPTPTPLLVVVEDADVLAPERPADVAEGSARDAIEQIARRGRQHGMGLLVITQRSAAISKGLLSQLDVLMAFASPARQDRLTIGASIAADDPGARGLLASLPSLAVGEALVWQPARDSLSRHSMDEPWTAVEPPHGRTAPVLPGRVRPPDPAELGSGLDRTLPLDHAGLEAALAETDAASRLALVEVETLLAAVRQAVAAEVRAGLADLQGAVAPADPVPLVPPGRAVVPRRAKGDLAHRLLEDDADDPPRPRAVATQVPRAPDPLLSAVAAAGTLTIVDLGRRLDREDDPGLVVEVARLHRTGELILRDGRVSLPGQ